MDKFCSINVEGEATADESFNENASTNSIYRSDNEGSHLESDMQVRDVKNEDSIINAPEIRRPTRSPAKFVPKTDNAVELDLSSQTDSDALCSRGEGNPQFEQLNVIAEDQGRNAKFEEIEGGVRAPSIDCIRKAPLSESFSNLLAYGSSSEESETDSVQFVYQFDSESEPENDNVLPKPTLNENSKVSVGLYRENNNSASENASDSSDSSSDESDQGAKSKTFAKVQKKVNSADGEMDLDDLPPVPDLSKLDINIKEEDCIQMGTIMSVVDRLVTIQSLPNTPAYDLDTLLFLDQGKRPLGHVYDVLGQVTSPMYVVRFNSKQEIESKGITKGLPVYSAPNTEHTQYVFLQQLMKIKGSDASWKGDGEVPQEFLDFSDDEAEYAFSKQTLNEQDVFDNKRKRNSLDKHKMFEVAMNLKNKVDTARHKMHKASCEPTPKRYMPQNSRPTFYHPPPNINQMRQQCMNFTRFPPPNFPAPPPSFGNFVNIPVFGVNPFGHMMPSFVPNPQTFPPPSFGPPIPPIAPAHVLQRAQPPPPPYGTNMVLPLPAHTSAMVLAKQTTVPRSPKSPPKLPQNTGVVPKAQPVASKPRHGGIPKLYMPQAPADYQQTYPPSLGLPKATVAPFVSTMHPPLPPNVPANMLPPFGPPIPPWPYALPGNPVNMANFRPATRNARQYKKQ